MKIVKRVSLRAWAGITALSVMAVALFLAPAAYAVCASPDPDDPTCGAAEDTLSGATGWIQDHGMVLLVGLLLIGIIVALLVKYVKRGAKAA